MHTEIRTISPHRSLTPKTGWRLVPALAPARRRVPAIRVGACLAVASAPLLYRGITGRWPDVLNGSAQPDSTRTALGGDRGVHVRESIRLEVPVADVYRFWRRLENLPQFMTHLDRVTEDV